ncbi:MAG TPA: AsnC family transcriptional regulator [Jatrophihabitantaceae bacterium]|nr:AsnC family transcriptional regulator [Jatrophihabitantaceae bacterium]
MNESGTLSLDGRLLLEALQVAPRAPWAKLGEVLGITAVTAAKRWARLSEAGVAWVTAAPAMAMHTPQCLAYVEITCHPEHRQEVASAIAQHSLAVSVELTTGSADILVTAAAADWHTMAHYLLSRLDQVEHVQSSRARIATRLYGEGSAWRLRELPASAVGALERISAEEAPADAARVPLRASEAVRAMLVQLSLDGRASIAELAECTGLSQTTARRRLTELLSSRMAMVRTDVNSWAIGWPVQVYLAANAPVEVLSQTAHALSRFREFRLTATVTGGPNLTMCAWLRTVEEIQRLELAIAARLPVVRIVDRLIVLRTIKRMGRLIDESGNAVGVVPINLWEDSLPAEPVRSSA